MRKDFAKVIGEPAKSGGLGTKGLCRLEQKTPIEELPFREKISRKYQQGYESKCSNLNWRTMRRWLRSQVGRPWNDVFSELSKNPHYIREWIDLQVEISTIIIDGEICDTRGLPIRANGRDELYVHPDTGILCVAKTKKRKSCKWNPYNNAPKGIKVDEETQYHKICGIWYEVKVRKGSPPSDKRYCQYDPVLKREFKYYGEISYVYCGNYYGVSKRQLNKRELKKLELKND